MTKRRDTTPETQDASVAHRMLIWLFEGFREGGVVWFEFKAITDAGGSVKFAMPRRAQNKRRAR
jgi:hypothetical protein